MNSSLSDEQLYNSFLHGDNEALDELLVRHKEGLSWFIYGIVKNINDAEDIMMDTFATLIMKKPHFNNVSTFKTWLYGIGRNLARNYLKKKPYVCEDVDGSISEIYKDKIEGNDLLTQIIEEEDNRYIYEAFNGLTKDYMMVLYLQYIEQLSIEQISKIMKKSVKQVYNLNSRARVRLKQQLEMIKEKKV